MNDKKETFAVDTDLERDVPLQEVIRQFNWKGTPLGSLESWPVALHTSVGICMYSSFPVLILWGEEYIQIYNDAYRKLIGKKHPGDLGSRAADTWQKSNWAEAAPILNNVVTEGRTVMLEDHKFLSVKNGFPEERYYTISYSPIFGGSKAVHGIFVTVFDKTEEVLNKRLLSGLRGQPLVDLFFQSPIAVTVLRGPEFIVETANQRSLEIWGKTSQQVLDKPALELIPDASRQDYKEILHKAYHKGERVELKENPITLVKKGALEQIYLKLVYEPLRDQNGKVAGVIVLADDISEQVVARKRIEENESRLKLAIEAAEIGTFEWDIQQSNFRYSERLAHIFGFKSTEGLTQKDFSEHIHPDDNEKRLMAHQEALKTGTLFYELRIIWPDKTIHWIKVNGIIIFDSQQKPWKMYGTTLDTTEQKSRSGMLEQLVRDRTAKLQKQYEQLQRSEERYYKMVDEVQDYAIILLDTMGNIQNWNRGAEKIKGYREAEIIGKHFSIFYGPEDRERNLPGILLKEAADKGRAFHEGYRIRKDGTAFWGSITITALHGKKNEIIGFSKVTRDLTDRKKSEDQLREFAAELSSRNKALKASEERHHRMIAEVQDYAIILLDENGIIQNWNAGAEKIKGYLASEIIGKSFKQFYTDEGRASNFPEKLLNEAKQTGRAAQEGWRVRKDGTRFWGSIVITALHNEQNEVIGFSKVTRDLTEKKVAEEQLNAYTAELEAQNRELEQFAYVASHDLQEPLRKIQTFTEIIQKDIASEEFVRRYLDKIDTSARRMSELIKAVLNYSRLSKEEKHAEVDLNSVIDNVKSDLELLLQEKNAVIRYKKLPVIPGNTLQVSQLFSNLIGNAIKFSETPPEIDILVRVVTDKDILKKPDNLPGEIFYEIVVSDNGIGFEQIYADQIFDIFQRLHVKQKYSGTGIGLAICKRIVENHKGHITAVSAPGHGSKFYVYLPGPTHKAPL